MPENKVEQLLSDTADFMQHDLDASEELRAEVQQLIDAGQKPNVIRSLNGLNDAVALITICKTPE